MAGFHCLIGGCPKHHDEWPDDEAPFDSEKQTLSHIAGTPREDHSAPEGTSLREAFLEDGNGATSVSSGGNGDEYEQQYEAASGGQSKEGEGSDGGQDDPSGGGQSTSSGTSEGGAAGAIGGGVAGLAASMGFDSPDVDSTTLTYLAIGLVLVLLVYVLFIRGRNQEGGEVASTPESTSDGGGEIEGGQGDGGISDPSAGEDGGRTSRDDVGLIE